MKSITILIPVYNEEDNILRIFNYLEIIKKKLSKKYHIELLFADNDSRDKSFEVLKNLAFDYKWVKIIRYSRNYGYQRSLFEALKNISSDAAVIIDCDLQDPPDLIYTFIENWEKGFKNVYGVRQKRKEKFNIFRKIYYILINKLSEVELPINAGDFRLIDKTIIEKIKTMKFDSPYLRGIIASIGYNFKGINYNREERKIGKSNAGFFKLLRLAIDSITQFSSLPIRILSIMGIFILFLLLIVILTLIILRIFFGVGTDNFLPIGVTTTWILILASIGVNALFLGVIGEYISSIHREILKLNKVHYKDKINFHDD